GRAASPWSPGEPDSPATPGEHPYPALPQPGTGYRCAPGTGGSRGVEQERGAEDRQVVQRGRSNVPGPAAPLDEDLEGDLVLLLAHRHLMDGSALMTDNCWYLPNDHDPAGADREAGEYGPSG